MSTSILLKTAGFTKILGFPNVYCVATMDRDHLNAMDVKASTVERHLINDLLDYMKSNDINPTVIGLIAKQKKADTMAKFKSTPTRPVLSITPPSTLEKYDPAAEDDESRRALYSDWSKAELLDELLDTQDALSQLKKQLESTPKQNQLPKKLFTVDTVSVPADTEVITISDDDSDYEMKISWEQKYKNLQEAHNLEAFKFEAIRNSLQTEINKWRQKYLDTRATLVKAVEKIKLWKSRAIPAN